VEVVTLAKKRRHPNMTQREVDEYNSGVSVDELLRERKKKHGSELFW
jgi:hypothetical protein